MTHINTHSIQITESQRQKDTKKNTKEKLVGDDKNRDKAIQISQADSSISKATLKTSINKLFKSTEHIDNIYDLPIFNTISDSSYQTTGSLCSLTKENQPYSNILNTLLTVFESTEENADITETQESLNRLNNEVKIFSEDINTTVLNNLKANAEDIRNTLKDDKKWIEFLEKIEEIHQNVLEMHDNLCNALNEPNIGSNQLDLSDLKRSQKNETGIFKITNRPAIERFQADQSRINEKVVIPLLEHCDINAESLKPIDGTYNILSLGAGAAHDAPAILKELGENSKYYAVDIDPRALKLGKGMMPDPRIEFLEKDISDENALSDLPQASMLLIRNPQFCPSNNFSYNSENASGADMVKLMLKNGLKKLDGNAPILFTTDSIQEHLILGNLINNMPEIEIVKNGENPSGGLGIPSLNIYPDSQYIGGKDQYFIFCKKADATANIKTPRKKAQ